MLSFFSSFKNEISHLLGNADLAIWLPLIGINILILGITQSITFWFNRHKQYSTIANQRMLQSISTNGSQITLGLGLNFGVSGLILGNLIGQAIALIYSIRKLTPQKIQKKYPMLNRKLLSHFKNLPLYNAPTALIDALRLNGINILLSIFFTVSVLGQFALAWRILQGPISLINGALSQVYYQHFTQLKQDDLHRFLLSCIKKSFLIGIVPFVLLFLLSEWLFTTFFGSSWQLAGQICSVLTPWLFFNFITSPISSIYVVLKQERVLLIFSIFYMLVPLSIIFLFNDNIIKTLTLVSISMSFLLCIFTYMALKLTKK